MGFIKVLGFLVAGLAALVLIVGLSFGFEWLGIEKDRILKPKRQEVEREVFENTPSYIHGMKQQLSKLWGEWALEQDPVARKALENVVRHRFAEFDGRKHLTGDQLAFWRRCTGQ